MLLYLPIAHVTQSDNPVAEVNFPTSQSLHIVVFAAELYLPVTQSVQTLLPFTEENFPVAQLVHTLNPVADANVPVAQVILLMPLLQYEPVEQATQAQFDGYLPGGREVGHAAAVVVATTVGGEQYLIELPKVKVAQKLLSKPAFNVVTAQLAPVQLNAPPETP